MSKMASHEPFGHLQPKLWAKEGPGVKLAIWLPTTKSQESTRIQRLQMDCDMALEIFWRELQDFFRPRPNRRFEQEVMNVQSPGSPTRDSFGTPPWECHSNVASAESYREYYMGEGGGFLRVWAVVSQVNPSCLWLVPTPRVFPKVN
jgi:hypothetical protein